MSDARTFQVAFTSFAPPGTVPGSSETFATMSMFWPTPSRGGAARTESRSSDDRSPEKKLISELASSSSG
jgi:hypothetical protein